MKTDADGYPVTADPHAQFEQATEAAFEELRAAYRGLVADHQELRDIVVWLSKQPWPQDGSQTWAGLTDAYDKAINPGPQPELPSRGYRVGK